MLYSTHVSVLSTVMHVVFTSVYVCVQTVVQTGKEFF